MSDRKFRFGCVTALSGAVEEWLTTATWVENAGYDVLLSPDTPNGGSPFGALSAAAAVTTRLRVGTFVLATPFRTPGMIAWEAASLDRLSGGRFELGLGAGRPDAQAETEKLGGEWGSAGRRVTQVGETIAEVKRVFSEAAAAAAQTGGRPGLGGGFLPAQLPCPPIMVAGAGPSLLGVAARSADIVAIGAAGSAGEQDFADRIGKLREQAGDRFDDLELSVNVWKAGDSEVPPWMAAAFGLDLSDAVDNKAVAALNGSPREMADVLLRRRDELGLSYITVNALAMREFAPVIELLSGR